MTVLMQNFLKVLNDFNDKSFQYIIPLFAGILSLPTLEYLEKKNLIKDFFSNKKYSHIDLTLVKAIIIGSVSGGSFYFVNTFKLEQLDIFRFCNAILIGGFCGLIAEFIITPTSSKKHSNESNSIIPDLIVKTPDSNKIKAISKFIYNEGLTGAIIGAFTAGLLNIMADRHNTNQTLGL